MRLILIIYFVLFSFFNLSSQTISENYVHKIVPLEPLAKSQLNNSQNFIEKSQTIEYLDGFGKIKQLQQIQFTSGGKDLIQHFKYDEFNRITKGFLPFPSNQTSGSYLTNVESNIFNYYQTIYGDSHPYSEVSFEQSTLNRRLKSTGPGDDWQIIGVSDNDNSNKFGYSTNGFEEIYMYEIDVNNEIQKSYYPPGQLVKNIIKNENWVPSDGLLNTKEIFTDKNGRKIAEIAYEGTVSQLNTLQTYHIYDQQGNLTYILTPKMFDLSNGLNVQDYSDEWLINDFLEQGNSGLSKIHFDIENNILSLNSGVQSNIGTADKRLASQTIKTLNTTPILPDMFLGLVQGSSSLTGPGGTPLMINVGLANIENGNLVITRTSNALFQNLVIDVSKNLSPSEVDQDSLDELAFQYIYDEYNRQIEQKVPGKGWEYMVYDLQDRPILTQDQNLRDNAEWLFNRYDALGRLIYSGKYNSNLDRATLQNLVNGNIDSSSNKANIDSRIATTNLIGGININYSNTAFPNSNLELLKVNYYDDYTFSNSDYNSSSLPQAILGQTVSYRTKGLSTSNWSKVIGGNEWIRTYVFYDNRGRVIYSSKNNIEDGYTKTRSKLDYRGKVLHSINNHKRLSSDNEIVIQDYYSYDHSERLLNHVQQINDQDEEVIANNTYNELGQIVKKNLGGESGNTLEDDLIDIVKIEINGQTIRKSHNSSAWNAGAATEAEFLEDGYIEFQTLENQKLMVGLSSDNTSPHYNTIDYAIYVSEVNTTFGIGKRIYVFESGVNKGVKTNYVDGDIFRVERVGTQIKYKKNGVTFYESSQSSAGKLIGDLSINRFNHKIKNFQFSSNYKDIVGLKVDRISDYSETILKKEGSNGWNAGLASVPAIPAGQNGFVKFKLSEVNKYLMVGLSNTNINTSFNTIGYAIYARDNNRIFIYEQGSSKGYKTDYDIGDEFKVERVGTTIYYKKNNEVFYTSVTPNSGELIADMSFFHVGARIYNLEVNSSAEGLQEINYNYNIRGWLTDINDVDDLSTDLFAYKIKYNESIDGSANVATNYNGNISQIIWKSAHNNLKKSYAFEYDQLNRLKTSKYRENDNLLGGAGKFETSGVEYDFNGNIEALMRSNQTVSFMDDLVYSYDSGNRLLGINDNTSDVNGFSDVFSAGDEYFYDANGNLIQDVNKGIVSILYNHLDRVERVNFNTNHSIDFTYDADGNKLRRQNILPSSAIVEVDYIDGFEYSNGQLQFFPTPEGYVTLDAGVYKYVYTLRDHLDNTRVSFSDVDGDGQITPFNEVLSNTDYYPMGLLHSGEYIAGLGSVYNYKYQSKEYISFGNYNMYDFQSRMYDATVGRWFNTDPQNQYWSPYLAIGNNYIVLVDPNGEYTGIDDAIAAVVGGVINVVANYQNIDTWGDGFAYFGIGAGAGVASLYGTPIAGGAILSAGNSAYTQYKQNGSVDLLQLGQDTVIGGATAGLGSKLSPLIAPYTNKLFSNVGNKLAQKYLSDALGNTVSGIGLGTIAGVANGESFGDAFGNATSLESLSQNLAISVIGTTGTHFRNQYHQNKAQKSVQEKLDQLYEGESLVDNIDPRTLSNEEVIQAAADVAHEFTKDLNVNNLTRGRLAHRYAQTFIDGFQSSFGERGLKTEFSFNRTIGGKTFRGRLDILDSFNNTIYDYKFGPSGWSSGQFNKYNLSFPSHNLKIVRPIEFILINPNK